MMEGSSEREPAGASRGVGCFLAVVLGGSMVALIVVLWRAHGAGRNAIDAYVASIGAGATVSAPVAGSEADAVTKALRGSTSLSIGNFQSQKDTSCFWVTLHGAGPDVEARFVLAERSSGTEVTSVSLARACECPEDIDEPCALR